MNTTLILDKMKSGEITKVNGRLYSQKTIKFYSDVMASLQVDTDRPIESVMDQLRQRGAESVTVHNYMNVVKFFLKQSGIEFKDIKLPLDEPAVYIPEPERVWEMINSFAPKSKSRKKAFAYIVSEAVTSARYLDISRWTYANIIQYKGIEYLRYTQSKTGKTVQLPLPQILKRHFMPFSGQNSRLLPEMNYHTLLRQVKLVFKEAGFTNEIKRVRIVGNQTKVEIMQEWEVMGTHRLRATAITAMLQSGMSESEVKKFSGHSPRSNSFSRYVEFSQNHIDEKFLNYINQ
jgi:integrase